MENKIQNLEDELKVLKNEVQAVLLDIKDFMVSSGGMGGGMGFSSPTASGVPMGAAGGGGMGDGLSFPPLDPMANAFNLTGGAVQPSPQQVYITQLPTAPAPEPAPQPPPQPPTPPTVQAFEDDPESLEIGTGVDALDEAPLTFGEETGSLDTDWSGGAVDQSALGPGGSPGFGNMGPGEGPGFGDMGSGRGPGFGQTGPGEGSGFGQTGPGEGPGFGQASRSECAAVQPEQYTGLSDVGDIEVSDEVDLPMLVILVPWLSKAVATVGKEQMEKLVELYDVARDIPPRLKEALLTLLAFYDDCSTSKPPGDVIVMQGIPLLIELDSLLLRHRTGPFESAVLSLLQESMTSRKKPRSRKAGNG